MELKDTIVLMQSEDYKDRFKAEYYQLKIRLDKLVTMLDKWDKGELNFTPDSPRLIYKAQVDAMNNYLYSLITRAALENIELD